MLTNHSPVIGVLVGSTRTGSFNARLAQKAQELSRHSTVVLEGIDQLPFFGEEIEDPVPADVAALRRAVGGVDALLVATPEYNAGMPGMLKNAIDWLSRPYGDSALEALPTAIIGASPSPGGAAGAVAEGRRVLGRARTNLIEQTVTVPRAHKALADELSPEHTQALLAVLDGLAESIATAQAA